MSLCEDIQRMATARGINSYNTPFKPEDLGLNPNKYGSFSDYCSRHVTTSGRHNKRVCLKATEWLRDGRPSEYVLLPENEWSIEE